VQSARPIHVLGSQIRELEPRPQGEFLAHRLVGHPDATDPFEQRPLEEDHGRDDHRRGTFSGLEAAVRYAIGLPTGDIRWQDVAELTELVANNIPLQVSVVPPFRVSDLTGIHCLSALVRLDLTELNLRNNLVSDLGGLSSLGSLTVLKAGFNSISDLSPLSELGSLKVLWLHDNLISDLGPLAGLTALAEVYLEYNAVSDLSSLTANSGLGQGDGVYLYGNPVDCAAQAENPRVLSDRGVYLSSSPCP
jgi:internalin A